MNRQEPVIDSRFLKCRTLKDRVDLPWETVENLTKQTQTPVSYTHLTLPTTERV